MYSKSRQDDIGRRTPNVKRERERPICLSLNGSKTSYQNCVVKESNWELFFVLFFFMARQGQIFH